jgi:hypothetical protein
MLVVANKWSNYLQTLHENEMWFSNIKARTPHLPTLTLCQGRLEPLG